MINPPGYERGLQDGQKLNNANQRMWDLLRYQRSALLDASLITEDEYYALAVDHAAVKRLEDYDAIRSSVRRFYPVGPSTAYDEINAALAKLK